MRLEWLSNLSVIVWLAAGAVAAAAGAGDLRLVEAVKQGKIDVARALLKDKIDVNVAEADGSTALAWAVYRDDADLVDSLIAAGANVNAATDLGITPLSLACTNLNTQIVSKLLQHGATPDSPSASGETPLMTASRIGAAEIVKLLLASGADVKRAEKSMGQTALMWAAAEGHSDVVRLLVEAHSNVSARSRRGWTPLLFAAARGDIETVRQLVSAGAKVDDPAPDGTTALMIAADGGNWPADYQYWIPSKRQANPSSHEQVGLFLLDKDANPRAYDSIGRTALHFAARTGKLELAKALLSHGARPNTQMIQNWPQYPGALGDWSRLDLNGATPFLVAAKIPDLEMMRLLVEGGADPNITTFDHTNALMVIAGLGRQEGSVTRMVPDEVLLPAARYVLELGNDVNASALDGFTAVHGAAGNGSEGIIRLLAEKGAKLNEKNLEGMTPEDVAEKGVNIAGTVVTHKKTAELLRSLAAMARQ